MFTATTPTGINLEQLFIEIPFTYKLGNDRQSIGFAPVLAVQNFEAEGLEPFIAASVHPDAVTNNGKDWSIRGRRAFRVAGRRKRLARARYVVPHQDVDD